MRECTGQVGDWGDVGQTRTVVLADGSSNLETLVALDRPGSYRYRLTDFTGSMKALIARASTGSSRSRPTTGDGPPGRGTCIRPSRCPAAASGDGRFWRRYAARMWPRFAARLTPDPVRTDVARYGVPACIARRHWLFVAGLGLTFGKSTITR